MQPLSGNQCPDLLTSPMNMSLVLPLPRDMHLCRSSSNVPHLPSFLEMLQNPHVLLTFGKVQKSLAPATRNDASTSKSGCSEPGVFCSCWLRNVLHATMPCTFWTSHLPKVLRAWCVLRVFTSKCASDHHGVHFFHITTSKSAPALRRFVHFDFEMCFAPQRRAIFHLSSATRRFSEPTFRPSGL